MSRPILSRPRTRVYGCNYDKGESYYRPMVDHLDRKYSGRPLFAEPRTSFADEIAARRTDIGSRGLAEPLSTSFEDLDLIWDSRGRPVSTDIFEDDFVGTHRRYKEKSAAAFELDLAELRRKRRDMQDRMFDMVDIGAEIERAKTTLEAADVAFQRHASKFDNTESIEDMALAQKVEQKKKKNVDAVEKSKHKPAAFKWTKVVEVDGELPVKALKARKARIATVKDENDETVPIRKSSGTKSKGKSGKSDKKKKTVTF